ncbi:MAG: NAD-dependent dihydropyrimidine dehydrogenase subunit PreT [Firmicutes bacterium]|nr:NAD-dependent dihydropyrimidine dehydrogenase subunit PreT [Bacillota bacterium]
MGQPMDSTLSWSAHQVLQEAARCLYCHDAPCVARCPVGIKVPEFIRKIVTGNYEGAANVIYQSNVFGAICADVCPQIELCGKDCNTRNMGEAISIARLQQFAAQKRQQPLATPVAIQGKRVAVVGAGPAGLSGAYALAGRGYEVVVFEGRPYGGGTAAWGIPSYRLSQPALERDLARISEVVRDIRYSTVVGQDVAVEDLLAEYDAVLLGCGLGHGEMMRISGEGLPGVLSAEQLLASYNTGFKGSVPQDGHEIDRVVIIGGGNTAMDAACVVKRAGASKVVVMYRRSLEEMPAWREEYESAAALGVEFRFRTAPIAILGTDRVQVLSCTDMKLKEGEIMGGKLEPVVGSEYQLAVDTVVIAIGQGKNRLIEQFGNSAKVFIAGDAANGGGTVVQAVAEGQKAALAIDEFLQAVNTGGEGQL